MTSVLAAGQLPEAHALAIWVAAAVSLVDDRADDAARIGADAA